MTDHALIACRVTLETKARVRRLAQRDGITESALIKQLLDVVLRSSGLDEPALGPPDKVNRQGRLYLRMAAQDLRLLQARSEARGMAPATYAALALRSHLRGGAPLPKAEYVALRQAIDQLTALGRNLNQIARVLNQGWAATNSGATFCTRLAASPITARARTWRPGPVDLSRAPADSLCFPRSAGRARSHRRCARDNPARVPGVSQRFGLGEDLVPKLWRQESGRQH